MTREEAASVLADYDISYEGHTAEEVVDAFDVALAVLSAEQDYKDFAEYVAMLIFEYDIEMDMETFSELACRKLAKLGIVKANGDKWERVK